MAFMPTPKASRIRASLAASIKIHKKVDVCAQFRIKGRSE